MSIGEFIINRKIEIFLKELDCTIENNVLAVGEESKGPKIVRIEWYYREIKEQVIL